MCTQRLRIINPRYRKIAKEQHFDIRSFSQFTDFMITVPCGHCDDCLKRRQQHWFLRGQHIFDRMKLKPSDCYFCTFSIKPEVYEKCVKDPYLPIRQFLDRIRKHPRFRYKDPETKRYKYHKVSFPYLFVIEFADGKRARERGFPTTHRMHYHAILFAPPLYWWQIRDCWKQNGHAWVEPLESMAGLRYVLKYCTKDRRVEQVVQDGIDRSKNGKLFVSHQFGRLSDDDIRSMREYMLKNDDTWFVMFVGNYRYSIPRYWKDQCFSKPEIRCRNELLVPKVLWRVVQRTYSYLPLSKQFKIYDSLLWQ